MNVLPVDGKAQNLFDLSPEKEMVIKLLVPPSGLVYLPRAGDWKHE